MIRKIFLRSSLLFILIAMCGSCLAQPGGNALNKLGNSGGNTWAVVIGISDYLDPGIPDLSYADRDAHAFANYLRSPAGGSLPESNLITLANKDATTGKMIAAFDGLISESKAGDKAIIYFSGHGDVERVTKFQRGYWLSYDSPPAAYAAGAFSLLFLQDIITTLTDAGVQVVIISDACRAGKLAGSEFGGAQATTAAIAKQFTNEIKILSCQPEEFSLEGKQWGGGRGCFSFHLIDALYGMADANRDGIVNLLELGRYLEDKVTNEVAPHSQIPFTTGSKATIVATVDDEALIEWQGQRQSGTLAFHAIDAKGLEDVALSQADSIIQTIYESFTVAINQGNLMTINPSDDEKSADDYYNILIKDASISKLHGLMTRNFAAALMDEGQQFINLLLKSDPKAYDYLYTHGLMDFNSIAIKLQRAADLLGPDHYIYNTLKAKEFYFKSGTFPSIYYHGIERDSIEVRKKEIIQNGLTYDNHAPYLISRLLTFYELDSFQIAAAQLDELSPNWAMGLKDIAYGYYLRGKMEESISYYHRALAVDSSLLVIYPWLGLSYYTNGDYEAANKYWNIHVQKAQKKLIENQSPSAIREFYDVGISLFNLARYDEAEQTFKLFLTLDSNDVRGWGELGIIHYQQGRFEEAEKALKISLSKNPHFIDALEVLGFLYLTQNRFVEGESLWEEMVKLVPNNSDAWNLLGLAKLRLFKYTEVEAISRKTILIDSTSGGAWNNLGLALLEKHQYEEAGIALQRAIILNPTAANTRKHLGTWYLRTGRMEEARQNFEMAVQHDPNDWVGYLGQTYLFVVENKFEKAFYSLEQALQKGVTHEMLQNDADLATLMEHKEQWTALMIKYFPDQVKVKE